MRSIKVVDSSRAISLKTSWKERENFTHGLAGTKIHNTWRGMRFTIKGRAAGNCPEWNKFNNFARDMQPSYQDDFRLSRLDKTKPFSKENCIWVSKENLSKSKRALLEYEGQQKTLLEWALQYRVNYNGLRQRYYKGKNYSAYEIIFGKVKPSAREKINAVDLDYKTKRIKASKMISAYMCRDKKRGFATYKFNIDWFINHILDGQCSYCGTPNNLGLDRLDNKKGHVIDNVVPACLRCNTVRQDFFTHEQMLKVGKFLRDEIDVELTITSKKG
jgi:hypothetical protein